MRSIWRLALFVVMAVVAAACSVGGGGSTPSPTTITSGGGSSSNSAVRGKISFAVHLPAAAAGTSSTVRRVASGRRGPKFISTASEGLAVQLLSPGTSTVEYEVDADIFDIGSTNTTPSVSSCTDDPTGGGRTCLITVVEPAGTYDFSLSSYSTLPNLSSGTPFAGAELLDTGLAGSQTLTAGGTTTVSVTLGGVVASVKVSAPQSIDAYATKSVAIGVIVLDASGEIILSSDPYANGGVTLSVAISNATGGTAPTFSLNGVPSTANGGASVVTTISTDIITLNYASQPASAAGEEITITPSVAAGAAATAPPVEFAPLFLTGPSDFTPSSPPSYAIPASTSEPFTLTEGFTTPATTVVADPTTSSSCANVLTVSAPTTTGGVTSFTVASNTAASPSGGCLYDISDGFTTLLFNISTPGTGTGNGTGSITTGVPGSVFYLTAFDATNQSGSAIGNPTVAYSNVTLPNVFITRLSDNKLYTVYDTADIRRPNAATHDSSGNVYVADAASSTVWEYAPSSVVPYPATVSATPIASYTNANASNAVGLAIDQHNGQVYVSDGNSTVYVYNNTSAGGALYATETVGPGADGIALDSAGNLYVASAPGRSVIEYGPVVAGASTPTAIRQIGTSADYTTPSSVTVGTDGTIYVVDPNVGGSGTSANIITYSASNVTTPVSTVATRGAADVAAIAVNPSGVIYQAENPNPTSGALRYYSGSADVTIGGPNYVASGTNTYVSSVSF